MDLARSPTGRTALRYSAVSLICIVISQSLLFLFFGILRLASAVDCNVLATAITTLPSYTLNRRWAWGRDGKSHLWREVVPFWTLAFAGLALSLYAVYLADHLSQHLGLSHLAISAVVNGASLGAYGVIWVGKFLIFNRFMFTPAAPAGWPGSARAGEGSAGGAEGGAGGGGAGVGRAGAGRAQDAGDTERRSALSRPSA